MEKIHTPPVAYDWAVNPIKLHQAEEHLRKNGIELNEKNIKARYIEIKGLLVEGVSPKKVKKAKTSKPKKAKVAKSK